jgi:hypothetical protein
MGKRTMTKLSNLLKATIGGVGFCVLAACAAPTDSEEEVVATVQQACSAPRTLTNALGLPARFMVGLGNDVTAAEGWDADRAATYELGTKLDIHYMYLSGFGWRSWNYPEGSYINIHADAARARGVTPMFTLYQGATWGDGNVGAFNDSSFMNQYWRGVRVMFERLAIFNAPAMVHLEPDLWGNAQKKGGDDPANVPVRVRSMVPECSDLPDNIAGLGRCMIRLGRKIAPKALIGLSASTFGAYTNGQPDGSRVASYLNKVGESEADFLVVETLDRDAGCFESGSDPNCQRNGAVYWDESNVQHPNFHDHLAWANAIYRGTGKGLVWWQMPLGVPSSSPGGWSGHYRDNRVRYLFSHAQEFVNAGGVAAVFGTGAPNQTTARTDGGQFKNAVYNYYRAPAWLP